jgi:hypothetical protein
MLGNEIRRKWGEAVGERVGFTLLDLVTYKCLEEVAEDK